MHGGIPAFESSTAANADSRRARGGVASGDNVKGEATAFCTSTPFKSPLARLINWGVLKIAPVETDQIRALRFLHYMCFVSISPRALRRAQVGGRRRLRAGVMLFTSAFNGATETYFRGFNQNLAEHMNNLWMGCEGWKGAHVYEYLAKFIEDYRRPVNFCFNAYPDTSTNLRTAMRLRAALDELIALAHGDPRRFVEEYRRAARVAWNEPAVEGRAA